MALVSVGLLDPSQYCVAGAPRTGLLGGHAPAVAVKLAAAHAGYILRCGRNIDLQTVVAMVADILAIGGPAVA